MNIPSLQDPRSTDLLSRVSEDVTLLRKDIGNLLTHTRRHTIPGSARDIADTARNRLAASRLYSADQLRAMRDQVNQPRNAWLGGALCFGLIAAGVYILLQRQDRPDLWEEGEDIDDEDA
jgi:hypothetical protein